MRKILLPSVVALLVVAGLAVGLRASEADSPAPAAEALTRGTFTDDITVKITVQQPGAETRVIDVPDPSDIAVTKITIPAGGSTGWHTHPGPVLATVHTGALTIINAGDCLPRVYRAGQAFVDPGHGNVHVGRNHTDDETIVYATFLEVPPDGKATVSVDDPGTCDS